MIKTEVFKVRIRKNIPNSFITCLGYKINKFLFFSEIILLRTKKKKKPKINTRVKVKLVKCQNEDPNVINEEKYMPKYKCDKLWCK